MVYITFVIDSKRNVRKNFYLQVLARYFIAKNPQKFTKSAIAPFALFDQSRSLKKNHTLHFSIFSLEIFNTAFQLNWQLTF